MSNYFIETQHHEWLLTNSRGSYALGTGNLLNQRKYHSLLTINTADHGLRKLVSSLEEKIEWRGYTINTDSSHYSNCIYPEGFLHLVKSWLNPHPIFLYSSIPHNNDILVMKEIRLHKKKNIVAIKYTNLGSHKLHLYIKPKLSLNNHHNLNDEGYFDGRTINTEIFSKKYTTFETENPETGAKVYGTLCNGMISEKPAIYRQVFYPWEVKRGYNGFEDLFSPVEMYFSLEPGNTETIYFSEKPLKSVKKVEQDLTEQYSEKLMPAELQKLKAGRDILSKLDYDDNILFSYEQYMEILNQAYEKFHCNSKIHKGYPWYDCDVVNYLYQIPLLLKIDHDFKSILTNMKTIYKAIKKTLKRKDESISKESVLRASLWYIVSAFKIIDDIMLGNKKSETYLDDCPDLIYTIRKITEYIQCEKEYFVVNDDGMIEVLADTFPQTWNDSYYLNKPCHIRKKFPFEINALWYNVVCINEKITDISTALDTKVPKVSVDVTDIKLKLSYKLQNFYHHNYVADRFDDEFLHDIRANALIGCALPFNVFTHEQLQKIVLTAEIHLLTPYGLRTLSYTDHNFRKKFTGDEIQRSLNRYQGSVWSWLLYPLAKTYIKAYEDLLPAVEIADKLKQYIKSFRNGFRKGHISSVAEIWDGSNPHFPKGCPAYSSGVFALYMIELIIKELEEKK